MAKGCCCNKGKKNDITPVSKKPAKPKLAESADKQAPQDQVKCLECACHITNETRALNCEKCGKVWKCNACLGIRTTTYDDLVSEAGKELHWLCEPCHELIHSITNADQVMDILTRMAQQMSLMEQQLDTKADTERLTAVEESIKGLENKICDGYKHAVKSLEQQVSSDIQDLRGIMNSGLSKSDTKDTIVAVEAKVTKLTETVEKQWADNHELRDCVQDAVRTKLQEDKEETEDIMKRSKNIIIHGLKK